MSLSNARKLSRSDGELNIARHLLAHVNYEEKDTHNTKYEKSKKRKEGRSHTPSISTLIMKRKRRKDIVSIKKLPYELEEIKAKNGLLLRCALRTFDTRRVLDIINEGLLNINAVDQRGITALHEAAIDGNLVCLDILVSNGAHINENDLEGYTPLDYAVFAGNFECASYLIEKGAREDRIRDGQIVCKQNKVRSITFG